MSIGARRPRPARGTAIKVLLLLAASLCGVGVQASEAGAPRRLTLAMADVPHAAPALVAQAEGYFAAEGLALDFLRCSPGRVCLEHLLQGRAHFATVADTPITISSFARTDFRIVATIATTGREHQLVVRGDRGIAAPADLKGRRIGVMAGTSGHYFVDTFLTYHGLERSDVSLVPLPAQDLVGPLARGDVDAAGLFDPFRRDAVRRLGDRARQLAMPAFFAITFNLVRSTAPATAATEEDSVRLLRALRRANRLIQAQPERALAIVSAATGMDPGDLAGSWRNFAFRLELSQPLVTTLESQARWAQAARVVPAEARMPDFLELIDPAPLQRLDPSAMRIVR